MGEKTFVLALKISGVLPSLPFFLHPIYLTLAAAHRCVREKKSFRKPSGKRNFSADGNLRLFLSLSTNSREIQRGSSFRPRGFSLRDDVLLSDKARFDILKRKLRPFIRLGKCRMTFFTTPSQKRRDFKKFNATPSEL